MPLMESRLLHIYFCQTFCRLSAYLVVGVIFEREAECGQNFVSMWSALHEKIQKRREYSKRYDECNCSKQPCKVSKELRSVCSIEESSKKIAHGLSPAGSEQAKPHSKYYEDYKTSSKG